MNTMQFKTTLYCWECGKPLKAALDTDRNMTKIIINVEPCARCLKAEWQSGHVDGMLERDKQITAANKRKVKA